MKFPSNAGIREVEVNMTDSEEERALRKRERLASIAAVLRANISPDDDAEAVVVVVSAKDGEFVGIASNVCTERANAILIAAATRDGHEDHPTEPGVLEVDTCSTVNVEHYMHVHAMNDGIVLYDGHKMLLTAQEVRGDNGPVVRKSRSWVKQPYQVGDIYKVMSGHKYALTYWVCVSPSHFVMATRENVAGILDQRAKDDVFR
jgi:hypothetical protein